MSPLPTMRRLAAASLSGLLLAAGAAAAATEDHALAVLPSADAPAAVVEAPSLSADAQLVADLLERGPAAPGMGERQIADAVAAFYRRGRYEPVWIAAGRPTAPALALAQRLARAAEDGLDPAAYATPSLNAARLAEPAAAASADVALSLAAARFVAHLAAGRVDPATLRAGISHRPPVPDLIAVLGELSRGDDVAGLLARHEPPHPEYRDLQRKLAELRQAKEKAPPAPRIAAGAALRLGMRDARVPLLRQRLGLPSVGAAELDLFDAALQDAVRRFQAAETMQADGIVGPATLARLNGPDPEEDIAAVLVNMERWRWMPRDLGARHVFVNIPEFMVRVRQDGAVAFQTRVIVGKPQNPTPIFSQPMDHLVVNPFWNVPSSIVTKEMLPDIRNDPAGYFSRRGYQVLARAGGRTRVVNPATIDWTMIDPRSIRIRQPPGEANALGRIKFMFPNQHAVYLHDTPTKTLFARDVRAFSHGCVRVEDPLAFADSVLVDRSDWNSERLKKLYGGPERRINLTRTIPVHLAYFTMTVGGDGVLHRFRDLYGIDGKLRTALGI